MRYFILLIYAGVTIALMDGCKKEASTIFNNSSSIIGNWELRQLVAQIGTRNYTSGNGSIYEFTDSTYSTFANGSLIKKGYYRTIADTSADDETGLVFASGEFTNRIIFDNDTLSNKIFYQISNNKLSFISGYFPLDGGCKLVYEKQ